MLYLSPSKLSTLKDCKRCFWLQEKHELKHPRGAFPSLPGGLDRVVKAYCDKFRAEGKLPPELEVALAPFGTFKLYPNQAMLKKWRYYKTAPFVILDVGGVEVKLQGAFDDALICAGTPSLGQLETPLYLPLDGKSKGSEPKDDGSQYYKHQMDCYGLMFKANDMPIFRQAVLWYWWPKSVREVASLEFESKAFLLPCEPEKAMEMIAEAVTILQGPIPAPSSGCEYCTFAANYRRVSMAYEEQGEPAVSEPVEPTPAEVASE